MIKFVHYQISVFVDINKVDDFHFPETSMLTMMTINKLGHQRGGATASIRTLSIMSHGKMTLVMTLRGKNRKKVFNEIV